MRSTVALLVVCTYCVYMAQSSSLGLKAGSSMVVSSEEILSRSTRSIHSTMTMMHVKSVIKSRLAKVAIETRMENSEEKAKEMTFSVRLPHFAFISKFTMVIGDVTFVGKVKEKKLAEEEYRGAQERGVSAGLVTANVRETEAFNVAANVPAHSRVTFMLEYRELLERKLGKYHHSLFLNPGQIVDDFSVRVFVTEQTGITKLMAQLPKGDSKNKNTVGYNERGELEIDTTIKRSKQKALLIFKPSQTQQRQLLSIPENERKVHVIYDVTREELGGELQMRDGYFVHFFAPDNLIALPKRVVFVIDTSGSMSGKKIAQTKNAFTTVLKDMTDADRFNVVDFSGSTRAWRESQMVDVTNENVNSAVEYVRSMNAGGGTNLAGGLSKAASILNTEESREDEMSAIILLTDGDPTVGITNEREIRELAKRELGGRISLFCLGFGDDLRHDFLKKLANDNDGIERKIYLDADAELQLRGFFQEVAVPLLLNVNFDYIGSGVKELSKTNFNKFFGGSEVIVVGRMDERAIVQARISGISSDGEVEYSAVGHEIEEHFSHSEEDTGEFDNFIGSMWTYLTIKNLLEDKALAETESEVRRIVDEITSLAVAHQLVTPLTSMVVVPYKEETTTSAATDGPPIPVCLRRGETSRNDGRLGPIWCPYIFDGVEYERVPTPRRSHFSYNTHHSAYQSVPMGSSARQHSMLFSHRRKAMPQIAYFSSSPLRSSSIMPMLGSSRRRRIKGMKMHSLMFAERESGGVIPEGPEVSHHCGGRFNNMEGFQTVTHPSSIRGRLRRKVYCDWMINYSEGAWIDLVIEHYNTTSTEIEITANHQTLFRHGVGVAAYKYISVKSNAMKIRMTIVPRDAASQVVSISYSKFIPDGQNREVPEVFEPVPSPTCGRSLSPTDSSESSGFISSPNYPSPYPSDTYCSWTFSSGGSENTRLNLRIESMDIETDEEERCRFDQLVITQGSEVSKLCGYSGNNTIDATSDVTVDFFSDHDIEGNGFKMFYEFL